MRQLVKLMKELADPDHPDEVCTADPKMALNVKKESEEATAQGSAAGRFESSHQKRKAH